MAFREGAAGTRFKITLERRGCFLSDKRKVRNHNPRSEFRGVRRSPVLVIYQSLLEMARRADVSLFWGRFRLQNIDVIHNSKISSWLASRSLAAIGRPAFAMATVRTLQPSLALCTKRRLERVTRLELATSSLARRCSTTELHPQFTYEKRHNKPSRKYGCPAILHGIRSSSNENTPEHERIPESRRMFVPLFVERRLLDGKGS
jgi:hypothetical protein